MISYCCSWNVNLCQIKSLLQNSANNKDRRCISICKSVPRQPNNNTFFVQNNLFLVAEKFSELQFPIKSLVTTLFIDRNISWINFFQFHNKDLIYYVSFIFVNDIVDFLHSTQQFLHQNSREN